MAFNLNVDVKFLYIIFNDKKINIMSMIVKDIYVKYFGINEEIFIMLLINVFCLTLLNFSQFQ